MPVKIIGMIGVTPPSSKASLHVIEGGLSPSYLTEFARAHDRAGFDMVLVGYSSSSAEGFLVALYAAMRTEGPGGLVAHLPGILDRSPLRAEKRGIHTVPRPRRPGSTVTRDLRDGDHRR